MEELRNIQPLDVARELNPARSYVATPITISIGIIALVAKAAIDFSTLQRRIRGVSLLVASAFSSDLLDPLGIVRAAPCQIENLSVCSHYGALTSELIEQMTPEQRNWVQDGIYFQTGLFRDRSCNSDHTHDGTALVLTMVDSWIAKSHSLSTADHAPVTVRISFADQYEDSVSKFFLTGKAIWHPDLIPLRNEIQVAVRAWDAGENALEKLEAFRASGSRYFLW